MACGIEFPDQDQTYGLWKPGVLAIAPPGNSQEEGFSDEGFDWAQTNLPTGLFCCKSFPANQQPK